jgi:hypothetical protein
MLLVAVLVTVLIGAWLCALCEQVRRQRSGATE